MGATRAAGARVGSTLLLGAVLSLSPAPVEARGWIATWNPELSAGRHRADFEPTLTRHLDDAFAVVTSTLGIRPAHKIRVHVYGRADYAAKFGQAKARRAGAHYRRGRIHINGGARVAGWFIGMLHHEMTHAVLDHRGKGTDEHRRSPNRRIRPGVRRGRPESVVGRRVARHLVDWVTGSTGWAAAMSAAIAHNLRRAVKDANARS